MAQLSDLVNTVMATLPGVPEPLAVVKYRDSAREFCRKTSAWRLSNPPASAVPGSTGEYAFDVPTDAEVFDLSFVRIGKGDPLTKATFEQIQGRTYATGMGPRHYRVAAGRLVIYPDPGQDVSADLTTSAILRPTRDAQALDDAFADEFGEIIEAGALARLMAMPSKQWTDFEGAAYHTRLFYHAIDEWTSRGADGGMKGVPRRVRYGGL